MTTPRLDNDESTSTKTLAKMIDHTYLKAFGGPEDIERLCQEAKQYGFATVAVNPFEVERCVELLKDDDSSDGEVRVGAAIGFPLGQSTTPVKVYETKDAIQRGASEIDFVVNIRALQSGNLSLVRHEMEQIAQVCGSTGTTCKVILETCYLTDAQKVQVCEMACQAGVDFVKTSTGFGTAGASVEDVRLMRTIVGESIGVKASGGIRDLVTVRAMVAAGATRIGTSNGVVIMEELKNELERESR